METRATVYSAFWRILSAASAAVSRGAPLALLAIIMLSPDPPANPLRLIRVFSAFCLAPAFLAWTIQQLFTAALRIADGSLVIEQGNRRIEIPADAIHAVEPWALPLPQPGLWLRLPSGRRFGYGIQVPDPAAWIDALVQIGADESVRAARSAPAATYAHAKALSGSWRWYQRLFKYVAFALVPAVTLFRVHQWIAYGGTFGEYYTYGLRAYLLGFGVYWGTMIVYLVMWASLCRLVTEIVSWGAVLAAPSQAVRARRAAEIVHRVLYYGGVPALLILRFAQ